MDALREKATVRYLAFQGVLSGLLWAIRLFGNFLDLENPQPYTILYARRPSRHTKWHPLLETRVRCPSMAPRMVIRTELIKMTPLSSPDLTPGTLDFP